MPFIFMVKIRPKKSAAIVSLGPLFSALKWRDLNIFFPFLCLCHHGALFLGQAPGCEWGLWAQMEVKALLFMSVSE